MNDSVEISWYGRCCFLVKMGGKRILFDPYDMYCKVDIGIIESDILLSSSSWHDHGHIGASPGSWIYTYPGSFENGNFVITGIEAKEDRGSPTVVYNVQYKNFSITNFADLGPVEEDYFRSHLTKEEKGVLKSTNIAFMRPLIEGRKIGDSNIHNEIALKYCLPNIIFPEHYFPYSFIKEQVEDRQKEDFLIPNKIVDEMPEAIGYPVEEVDNYKTTIRVKMLSGKVMYKFCKLHPQVKYEKSFNVKMSW